jgi:hypothetical protein
MSGVLRENAKKPPKRWRFSLQTLFWWQLFLVPLFLSPLYGERPQIQHPYVGLVMFTLAPVCYSALFVLWARDTLDRQRLPVLAAVRRGAMFGALFGLLAWGGVLLLHSVEVIAGFGDLLGRPNPLYYVPLAVLSLGERLLVLGYLFLVHYVLLGAATGGAIGLARDVWPRRAPSDR